MIDLAGIRDHIVTGLGDYVSRPVIFMEQNKPKPQYPFVSYKFISPYIPGPGQPSLTFEIVPSDDPNFEDDIEYTRTEMPTTVMSLTTYSKDIDEAQALALKCREWIIFFGSDYLNEQGIVVVEASSLQNRDSLIVGDYERRVGFDVTIRVTSEIKHRVPTIEHVNLIKN